MEQSRLAVICPVPPSQLLKIARKFPDLIVKQVEPSLVLSGQLVLATNEDQFDSYLVRIEIDEFPNVEPKVFELGGRVKNGHHLNGSGTCCTGVFEVWRAENPQADLSDFLEGPVRNFFLGHQQFERTNAWPFGELSHGFKGMVEATANLLGVAADEAKVTMYLRFLARDKRVRYRRCPCGSGQYTRNCHGIELRVLHQRIDKAHAKAILLRLNTSRPKR